MSESEGFAKELDKIAKESRLQTENRQFCLRVIREGPPAQSLRALAILAASGEPQTLPSTLKGGNWPDLPKREDEVRALFRLAQRDDEQLRAFMTALLSRKGPSEGIRERIFREFAENYPGVSARSRMALAVASLESRLRRLEFNRSDARWRLLKFAGKVLKPSKRDASEDNRLLNTVAALYELAPEPKPHEASALVGLVLKQVRGSTYHERVESLRRFWDPQTALFAILKRGWSSAKNSQKGFRDRFAAEVFAYACTVGPADASGFLPALLDTVLPPNATRSEWTRSARANLKSLEVPEKTVGDGDLAALASAVDAAGLNNRLDLRLLQDLPGAALSQLEQALKACAKRVGDLQSEIDRLKRPETTRALAGDLIREEVERDRSLLQKFQTNAQRQRVEIASQLEESLHEARRQVGDKLPAVLETAVQRAIAHLRGYV
jgi:hypothetical protein